MNEHLSSEQITEWMLLGRPSRKMEPHARDCAECLDRILEFGDALGAFRNSVRDWSEQYESHDEDLALTHKKNKFSDGNYLWLAMAATVLILLGSTLPIGYNRGDRNHATVLQTAAPMSDEAFLSELDQEVSRTVPSSMKSLVQLVSSNRPASWSSTSSGSAKE